VSFSYRTEQEHALEAVVRAASLCRQVQSEMVRPLASQKADRSPVTVADYGSQAIVCRSLAAAFPGDPVVAEESARALRRPDQAAMLGHVTRYVQRVLPAAAPADICDWIDHGQAVPAARFWTLDPIDGTKGFLRGDQYAIALALIVDGRVQVGALACPNLAPAPPSPRPSPSEGEGATIPSPLRGDGKAAQRAASLWDSGGRVRGEPRHVTRISKRTLPASQGTGGQGGGGVVFVAARGQGAAMLPLDDDGPLQPIHVASLADPAGARFVESFEPAHADQAAHQALARVLGITRPALRMDSQAKYGVVARGEAAIYLRLPSPQSPDYRENIWDHAAGALLVEEAGGRVTDALGADLDFGAGRKLSRNRGVIVSNGQLHEAILNALASG
jgi:3'(2'), 5'-bisphosphate nucleotidase